MRLAYRSEGGYIKRVCLSHDLLRGCHGAAIPAHTRDAMPPADVMRLSRLLQRSTGLCLFPYARSTRSPRSATLSRTLGGRWVVPPLRHGVGVVPIETPAGEFTPTTAG